MSTQHILQPDAELLLKYGYIEIVQPTKTSKKHNVTNGVSYNKVESGYILKNEFANLEIPVPKFKEKVIELANHYCIKKNLDTLIYIILDEHDLAFERISAEYRALHYRAVAQELAQELKKKTRENVIKENPDNLTAVTMSNFYKKATDLAKAKVRAFTLDAVKEKLIGLDRTVMDLGPDVLFMLIGESAKLEQLHKLNKERINAAAKLDITLRSANSRRTQIIAEFMLRTWNFINQETDLKAPSGKEFTDAQLGFLYEVAVLLKLKLPVKKGIGTDRMRNSFYNYLRKHTDWLLIKSEKRKC